MTIQEIIKDLDAKCRRAPLQDVAVIADLNPIEVAEEIRIQVRRRPKGRYEVVGIANPYLEGIDVDEFDREAIKSNNGVEFYWVISISDPNFSEDSFGILFTDD